MPKRARPSDPVGDPPGPSRRLGASGGAARHSTTAALLDESYARPTRAQLRFKSSQTSNQSPQTKRARSSLLPLLSLEGSLSEEILLRCLSFLNAHDLVTVARVSTAWYRLSQDSQLWRSLYLRTYASPSVRRQALAGDNTTRTRPWQELYKVSTNWRTGSARATTLGKGIRKAVLPQAPPDLSLRPHNPVPRSNGAPPSPLPASEGAAAEDADTLLQFHHNYILAASRSPVASDEMPSVTVHQTLPSGDSAVVGCITSPRLQAYFAARPDFRPPLSVSELRLDEARALQADGPLLAVFYSTGQFSLFRLTLPSEAAPARPFSATEVYASLALGAPPAYPFAATAVAAAASAPATPFDPVVHARLHRPLLVTLSRDMTLRFWRIREESAAGAGPSESEEREAVQLELEEAETPLQTRESWSPVVLSLTKKEVPRRTRRITGDLTDHKERKAEQFTVSLAYCAPVFPASWTVGIQEFTVTLPPPLSSSSAEWIPTSTPKMSITARNACALPPRTALPTSPRRSAPLLSTASPSRPSAAPVPRTPMTAIEHSHPFIVTSRTDNILDVFEVLASPSSAPQGSGNPNTGTRPYPDHLRPHSRPSPLPSQPPLQIVHRQTLFGHTARVASVALRPATTAGIAHSAAETVGTGTGVRCISAGDDGAVKVWSLVPSLVADEEGTGAPRGATRAARKRGRGEVDLHGLAAAVIDVRAVPVAGSGPGGEDGAGGEGDETTWRRMKRRRVAGLRGREDAGVGESASDNSPQRVRRVWVEEDKIVVAERPRHGGEETLRVLRFD